MRVVKAFAREERQLERFRGARRRACSTRRWSRRGCRPSTTRSSASCPSSGWPSILLVGGRQVIDGHADASASSPRSTPTCCMLLAPMRTLGISLGLAQRATAAGRARCSRSSTASRAIVVGAGRARRCRPARATSSCADVTLSTTRARRARALRDVDARRARPGTTVALVGATGSGKTTLVAAARRASTTPSAGAVLVDGADVRDVDVASLRRAIAVVDDDPFLFSATRRTRTSPTRAPDATREEVERAARARAGPRASSSACPRATTRASASAG